MKLEYRSVVIRDANAQDAPRLAAWWNDGDVMAHAGFPQGLGTTPEKVARKLAADSDGACRHFMLLFDGEAIGEMCCHHVDGRTARIDIKICESPYQERGIGPIALSLLIQHLLSRGYEKITLDTDLANTRAQHVYEKLGFQKLRIKENSWRDQLGQLRSSVDYELGADTFHNFAV